MIHLISGIRSSSDERSALRGVGLENLAFDDHVSPSDENFCRLVRLSLRIDICVPETQPYVSSPSHDETIFWRRPDDSSPHRASISPLRKGTQSNTFTEGGLSTTT